MVHPQCTWVGYFLLDKIFSLPKKKKKKKLISWCELKSIGHWLDVYGIKFTYY